jgi:hypothetical protein
MNFDLDLSVDVLARTPATMQALLGGLTEPWTRGTEGPETFSPFDVVGHLIDGEKPTGFRVRASSSRAARIPGSIGTIDFVTGPATSTARLHRCSTSLPSCGPAASPCSGRGISRRPSSIFGASTPHWGRSHSGSCWRPGSSTTWATLRKPCG